jgi:eukaryotic-like serine/threonine-protein kinase
MTTSQRLRAGTLLGGRYRLVEPLPGAGRNWHAHDEIDERDLVARVVVLPAAMPAAERDQARQRALHDAAAVSRVHHPAVAQVVDAVVDDGTPWVISVLPAGRSLGDAVRADGPLPADTAARIGLQVLDALLAAGVPHGDLTPDDLLLDEDGRVVVTGFATTPVDGTETPGYRAPEGGPSVAADLWALGVTLYVAVEGRLPEGPGGGALRPALDRLLAIDPDRRSDTAQVWRALAEVGGIPPVERPEITDPDVAAALAAFDAALPRPRSAPSVPAPPATQAPPITPTPAPATPPLAPATPDPAPSAAQAPTPVPTPPAVQAPTPAPAPATPASPIAAAAASAPPVATAPTASSTAADPTDPATAPADPHTAATSDPTVAADVGRPGERKESAGPTDPVDPADPVDPVDPADPVDPVDPADPADTTDRADRTDPADHADPVGLERSGDLRDLAEPGDRSDREGHGDPAGSTRDVVSGRSASDAPPAPVTPAGATVAYADDRRRSRWSWAAVAAVAVLVVAVLVPLLLVRGSTQSPPAAAPPPTTAGPTPTPTGPVPPPAGYRLYRDPAGWSIAVPGGWTTARTGSAVSFRNGDRVLRVTHRSNPPEDPYAAQLKLQPAVRAQTPGYDFMRIARVSYRDWPTADWEYRAGTLPVTHTLIRSTIPGADQVYDISWTTLDRRWAADKALFDNAVLTFDPGA